MTKRRLARCYILSPFSLRNIQTVSYFVPVIVSILIIFLFCVGGKKNWWMAKLLLELRCEHFLLFCSLSSSTSLLPSSCLLLYFVQVFLIICTIYVVATDNCFSTKITTVVPMNFSKGMKYLSIYSANYSPLFLSNKILQFVRKKGGLGLKRTF
jgi:hypothetical protein